KALFDRVPEIIFWHIPSCAYKKVAPLFGVHKPCVGSINKEKVATQEAETGIMKLLVERVSAKITDSEMHSQFNNVMLSYMVNFFILKLMIG
ncbi:hypothetical protein GBA52_024504, partial [Prunus armeniaca]